MKILFILDNYWPFKGGAETLFKNLAEGLAHEGNSVTVLTRRIKGTNGFEELNGVKVHRLSTLNRYLFTFLAIPNAICLAKDADIIHTTTFNSAFPAWMAAKISGNPSLITIHEVWLGKWKHYTDMNWLNASVHTLLESPIYRLGFDRHICVSNSTRKQLLGSCRWISSGKTEVIYNGLDYSHFNPKKHNGKAIRKKLGLEKNFVCLTYGRAAPSKGLEYAAKSLQFLEIQKLKYIFIVAKDYSKNYLQLQRLISKSKENALLLEPVSYQELPDYIAAADCVIIPSLSEGFGYAAAEACAMGRIVIASNTTSLPETVSGKFLLVEPKSPKAIAEGIEKAYYGKYSKSKQKRFTIEQNVKSHIEVYKSLLRKL